ncbi:MAG: hypothetical protein MJ067_00905 [Oscillospiraceae bacterium]|nr:hypothetical protein [Oscillospiraceae bacterium]
MGTKKTHDNQSFALTYTFFKDTHETEISMLVNGENILSFSRENQQLTTRWNLDELAFWLRDFINNEKEDPYPVESKGEYAAIKDINSREFDTDDDEEFDAYYDKLDEWNARHRWHPASGGAILADLYFQFVDSFVEISWNNQEPEEGIRFKHELGGVRIPKERFVKEVDLFLKAYANQWF